MEESIGQSIIYNKNASTRLDELIVCLSGCQNVRTRAFHIAFHAFTKRSARCLYSGGRVIGPRRFSPPPSLDDDDDDRRRRRRRVFRGERRDWVRSGTERSFSLPENYSKMSLAETLRARLDLHTGVRIAALLHRVRPHVTFPLSALSRTRRYAVHTHTHTHVYIE